jgi:hypothetical protein
MVRITYDKSESEFIFLRIKNAKKLTNENVALSLPNDPTQPGPLEDVKTKGEEIVGGNKLQYIIGTFNIGTPLPQLRGAMLTDGGQYLVRLTGTTTKGPYDMEATQKLLASIK